MNNRAEGLITKKDKTIKKNKKEKIEFENYNIAKGITLKIINAKVDKAKVDIYGNFIYKVDNESHFEVGVEIDFSKSKDLKIKNDLNEEDEEDEENEEKQVVIQEIIEPYSSVLKKINQEEEQRKQNLLNNKCNTSIKKEIEDKVDVNVGKICEIEYKIGFKIDAKIKFQINFPNIQKQHKLIKSDTESIKQTLMAIENILKNVSFERMSRDKLQELLIMNNIFFFVDPLFPPTQPSEITFEIPIDKNVVYTERDTTVAVHWRRITSLLPLSISNIYSNDDVSPVDVIYGFKKNTNIICILSHLAENYTFVQRILPDNTINPLGIYSVKFFVNGSFENIIIDNFVPCFAFSHPIYSYSQNSGWVMLIEKALAKFFNGYENLSNLEIENTYRLLTGFPVHCIKYDEDVSIPIIPTQQSINLQESSSKLNLNNSMLNKEKNADEFFAKLEAASNEGYLMCAYSDLQHVNKQNKKYDCYFLEGYCYPIVTAVKLSFFKIIIVRNIWKDVEFHGEFYHNASKLPQKMVRYLEKFQDKTLMAMTPTEFVKYFNNVVIIQSKKYYELSLRSSFIRCQDNIEVELENILSYFNYEITVTELSDVKIQLSILNDDYFEKKYLSEKMDMSIGILTKDDSFDWQKFYYKEFEFEKEIISEVQLPPGKYYIIPLTMGYCIRKNKNCYNVNPNFFLPDGTLNHDVIDKITQHLFYLYDPFCKGIIEKRDIINIYERLNLQFDEEEDYEKILSKYCKYSDGITLLGLKKLLRDIFSYRKDNWVDYLRNIGYDKHLYPYLNRFYYIKFYSSNELIIKPKINIGQNYEKILNNLLLQEVEAEKKVKGADLNLISYKSSNGIYYIDGVKNYSRRERKEVVFDATKSVNLFASTNLLKYSKFIDINKVEFFMYFVIDNFIEARDIDKIKQTETKDRDKERENLQLTLRSNISSNQLLSNKLDHKKIVNIESTGLIKNYT